jgi:hypothetical protein
MSLLLVVLFKRLRSSCILEGRERSCDFAFHQLILKTSTRETSNRTSKEIHMNAALLVILFQMLGIPRVRQRIPVQLL